MSCRKKFKMNCQERVKMSCRERVNIPSQGWEVLAVEMEPAAAGDATTEKVSIAVQYYIIIQFLLQLRTYRKGIYQRTTPGFLADFFSNIFPPATPTLTHYLSQTLPRSPFPISAPPPDHRF